MSYLYSFVVSVGGGESCFVCCCLPVVVWYLFGGGGPLPLGAWGGLRCFVVALPWPSMWLFFKIYYIYYDTVTFCVHCIYKESKNSINRPDYVI